MRKKIIGGLLAAGALLATADTALAIRWGQPDAGEHPQVGIMVGYVDDDANPATNPVPAFRCTGTMVTPTVFLTAGHCTEGTIHTEIWFDETDAAVRADGYPRFGEGDLAGTPHLHPQYDPNAFYRYDLGVVTITRGTYTGPTASVAPLGYMDQFLAPGGKQGNRFEVVGYGLQRSMPDQTGLTERLLDRRKADVRVINDRNFGSEPGVSVIFSNNASTGGTCFGDSGGPAFASTTSTMIVAVTSFGINERCAGTGGSYRVDTADDLAWLATFGVVPGG